MCGIYAYRGPKPAVDIVVRWLQHLEYRGYDSAGVMIMNSDWAHHTSKAVGKVAYLQKECAQLPPTIAQSYTLWIGHTRWATHGKPSLANTHPHCDAWQHFFVVHNWIIENQRKLKEELFADGYVFYSQTDTEVIPALLAKYWDWSLLSTVQRILPLLHGAYALVIVSTYAPDEMIGVCLGSPLLLWCTPNTGEFLLASDAQALAGDATSIVPLEDNELVHIKWTQYTIYAESTIIIKNEQTLSLSLDDISRHWYEHFMLKEIFEQPAILERIFMGRVDHNNHALIADAFHGMHNESLQRIIFVGSGTSYNAWMTAAWRIEHLAGIPCRTEIASEYLGKHIPVDDHTLHIFLSQSWETADSIQVLKHILQRGWRTFGVVNRVWSTIARLTHSGLFMRAWSEIGVASTKAFTAMLACLFMFALFLAQRRWLPVIAYHHAIDWLIALPNKIREVLNWDGTIRALSKELAQYQHMYYLGRQYLYPVAQEWSLKMKEISYIHSEAYPSWELKHWPLALVDESMPSILLAPDDIYLHSNLSTLSEVQARAGRVLFVGNHPEPSAQWSLILPHTDHLLTPFTYSVALQLLAYHTANILWRDIDKPRNLAKSVTVT
jgi:glucosamine--fructose-6-phosphate aminotransferase (isomerizing)